VSTFAIGVPILLGSLAWTVLVERLGAYSARRKRLHPIRQARHGQLAWKVRNPPQAYDQVILAIRDFHRLHSYDLRVAVAS
jgi:hypothetical protein